MRLSVEDERGHGRPPRLDPALAPVSGGVQGLEPDATLAKELPGRRAARSGRVPEEQDLVHCAMIAG
jgi:hypothetical protein